MSFAEFETNARVWMRRANLENVQYDPKVAFDKISAVGITGRRAAILFAVLKKLVSLGFPNGKGLLSVAYPIAVVIYVKSYGDSKYKTLTALEAFKLHIEQEDPAVWEMYRTAIEANLDVSESIVREMMSGRSREYQRTSITQIIIDQARGKKQ